MGDPLTRRDFWLPRLPSQSLVAGDDPLDPRVRWVVPDVSDPRVRRVRPDWSDPRWTQVVPDRADPRLRHVEDPEELLSHAAGSEDELDEELVLLAGSGGHPAGSWPRFGLNRIQSFSPNRKYGNRNDPLEDAARLGVETLRMVGGLSTLSLP